MNVFHFSDKTTVTASIHNDYQEKAVILQLADLNGTKCCRREEGFKECQCRAGLFLYRPEDCR